MMPPSLSLYKHIETEIYLNSSILPAQPVDTKMNQSQLTINNLYLYFDSKTYQWH
jgi:hypothetical protein